MRKIIVLLLSILLICSCSQDADTYILSGSVGRNDTDLKSGITVLLVLNNNVKAQCQTDDNGNFSFTAEAGTYTVRAEAENYSSTTKTVTLFQSAQITLPEITSKLRSELTIKSNYVIPKYETLPKKIVFEDCEVELTVAKESEIVEYKLDGENYFSYSTDKHFTKTQSIVIEKKTALSEAQELALDTAKIANGKLFKINVKKDHGYEIITQLDYCISDANYIYAESKFYPKSDGWVYIVLSDVGKSITVSMIHDWDEGSVILEPTCVDKGQKEFHCKLCSAKRYSSIAATKVHTYVDYRCSVCKVWGQGPTGGYVFYDCDEDNATGNQDGLISTDCGWRYLECGSVLSEKYCYGFYRTDGVTNLKIEDTKEDIGTGQSNTDLLISKMGQETYVKDNSDKKDKYGALVCSDYVMEKDNVTYDDWFLPSIKELELIHKNLHDKKLITLSKGYYLSSSENEISSANVEIISTVSISNVAAQKSLTCYIIPVRSF
jgi:hypothetical protein